MLGPMGPFEWGVILVLVLLLFGPKNLPKLANSLGRSVRELKNGLSNLGDDIRNSTDEPRTGDKSGAATRSKTESVPPVTPVDTPTVEHTEKQA